MNTEKLHNVLMKIEHTEIDILSLKDKFTPVKLASELDQLTSQGIINVDWKKGIIIKLLDYQSILTVKNSFDKNIKNTPDYMKSTKKEINKPYI